MSVNTVLCVGKDMQVPGACKSHVQETSSSHTCTHELKTHMHTGKGKVSGGDLMGGLTHKHLELLYVV